MSYLCGRAFATGSFVPVFRGDDGFAVKDFYAFAPTDFGVVVYDLYMFYNEVKNKMCYNTRKDDYVRGTELIPEMCKESLLQMIDETCWNVIDAWCAYNILFELAVHEKAGRAPFRIVDDELASTFRNSLKRHENDLKNAKVWAGRSLQNGLWEDIVESSRVLWKHGVKVCPSVPL